ncbi:hypothetical protein H1R20_g11933, partial [Candolleomyces eurysporus]
MKLLLSSIIAAATAIVGVLAAPSAEPPVTDNQATAYYTNTGNGTYSLQWTGTKENLVGGKGWNPGTADRVISYNGTYQPRGSSLLGVYGWTRNALTEYYIVESYGRRNPSSAAKHRGSVRCNGARYDILSTWRKDQPSIEGTATFEQFWSVRSRKKRLGREISGTVDVACHFDAWKSAGMNRLV